MSVQKPLKCNKLDFFDEGVDEKLWNLYGKVSGLGLEPLTVRLFDEQYIQRTTKRSSNKSDYLIIAKLGLHFWKQLVFDTFVPFFQNILDMLMDQRVFDFTTI